MAREYYSDSVQGPRPRTEEQIDCVLWSAILSLLERCINTNLLAHDFPELCEDGGEPYGTDRLSVMQTIRAEIPGLPWPPSERDVPPTLAVLDLLEFLHRHAKKAIRRKHHSFFDHHHLYFDHEEGREELRAAANRLLARNGMAYELNGHGAIVRLAPPAIRKQLRHELPPTRDADLDALLGLAIARYLDPDPQTRRDALEKLWDAFERAKTVPWGKDKKARAHALAVAATRSPDEANLIEAEMVTLTRSVTTSEYAITRSTVSSRMTSSSITSSRACTRCSIACTQRSDSTRSRRHVGARFSRAELCIGIREPRPDGRSARSSAV